MDISFVISEPATPENVGAAARAMKTMGFSDLRLVNPCDHLSEQARWLAHASEEILEKAQIFSSLEEAVSSCDFIMGTSAKRRNVRQDYHPLQGLAGFLEKKQKVISHVAVVFGREESGLTNDELRLCDLVTSVQLKSPYPSLNLAQAVMLYAYELSSLIFTSGPEPESPANTQSLRALKQKTEKVLIQTGFTKDSNIFPRFLERINFLGEDDIHLLHSFCNKFLENKK